MTAFRGPGGLLKRPEKLLHLVEVSCKPRRSSQFLWDMVTTRTEHGHVLRNDLVTWVFLFWSAVLPPILSGPKQDKNALLCPRTRLPTEHADVSSFLPLAATPAKSDI